MKTLKNRKYDTYLPNILYYMLAGTTPMLGNSKKMENIQKTMKKIFTTNCGIQHTNLLRTASDRIIKSVH